MGLMGRENWRRSLEDDFLEYVEEVKVQNSQTSVPGQRVFFTQKKLCAERERIALRACLYLGRIGDSAGEFRVKDSSCERRIKI